MSTSSTQPDPDGVQPPKVERLAAGPALAAHLASVDTATLNDHDLLENVADWERLAAWVSAGQLAALTDFARRPQRIERPGHDVVTVSAGWARPGRWVRDFADDEVAARLKITRRDAANRIGIGCALVGLPKTRASLSAGRIDLRRATVMAEETRPLDAASAREIDAAMNQSAERLSAARLRDRVRTAVIHADPAAARTRATRAVGERNVTLVSADDGMADLWAHLPAVEALAIHTAITAAARASKAQNTPGDDRTMDQRRADAFTAPFTEALATGVLAGTRLARRRGAPVELQVVVAATSLLGLDDAPGQLKGYGPVPIEAVRELEPESNLRRLLTDPLDGTVLDVGTTVYRPPTPILRHVQVRDQLCTFPGCGASAATSEFDHTIPFPRGSTSVANGRMRCKRHHDFKTSGSARVKVMADGSSRWTLPTGHVYEVPLPGFGPIVEWTAESEERVRRRAERQEQERERERERQADPDHGGATDTDDETDDGTGSDPPRVPPF